MGFMDALGKVMQFADSPAGKAAFALAEKGFELALRAVAAPSEHDAIVARLTETTAALTDASTEAHDAHDVEHARTARALGEGEG